MEEEPLQKPERKCESHFERVDEYIEDRRVKRQNSSWQDP
jgi:hypothetical protein